MIERLTCLGDSQNGWFGEILLDYCEGLVAFHIPTGLLGPFRVVKNGFNQYVKREMNLPKAANRPISCYTPFLEVGV